MYNAWKDEMLFVIKRLGDKNRNIESLNNICDIGWSFIRKISRSIKLNNLKMGSDCISWGLMLMYASMQNDSENKGIEPLEITAVETHLPNCEYCQHQYLILRVRDALVYVENEIWRLNEDTAKHESIIERYMIFYNRLIRKIFDKNLEITENCPDVEQYMHFYESITQKDGVPFNSQIARKVADHLEYCEYCKLNHLAQMALFSAEEFLETNYPETFEYYGQKQVRIMLHIAKHMK